MDNNPQRSLRMLQVSTMDIGGGAEKVAWNLFQSYRNRGYVSWLAVGHKRSEDPDILLIHNDKYRSRWTRGWFAAEKLISPLVGRVHGARLLRNKLHWIGSYKRQQEIRYGIEDFNFSGSWKLPELSRDLPDIIHFHNLHGGYFDLRALSKLSRQFPLVFTLHDAWLLSGHCAHSFDCERWKAGCGKCPDLSIYPSIRLDATAYNWRRKKEIFLKSHLYVATPSRWLMQKVEQSILAPAIVESKVIPNGVDLSIFHPADKRKVRLMLGMPEEARVLLFTANGVRQNIWKDYKILRTAVEIVAERLPDKKVLFIALGDQAHEERIGKAQLRFIPFQNDPRNVAIYYQAADIYLHAARADTFPNTILEALACGTPVIATAVGGIPEQIEEGVNGFLTPPGDAEAMAARVVELLEDEGLRQRMGVSAEDDARRRFDLERMVGEYLEWYEQIIDENNK